MGLVCLGIEIKLTGVVVERKWVEGVSWGRALTKAGGRPSMPEPGWLESPEQAVEGDVGIWYLGELFCPEIWGRMQRCVT